MHLDTIIKIQKFKRNHSIYCTYCKKAVTFWATVWISDKLDAVNFAKRLKDAPQHVFCNVEV